MHCPRNRRVNNGSMLRWVAKTIEANATKLPQVTERIPSSPFIKYVNLSFNLKTTSILLACYGFACYLAAPLTGRNNEGTSL